MVQVGSEKCILRMFKNFPFILFSSQIWLNWLTDDSHLGHIRKFRKENTGSDKIAKNIKWSFFVCFISAK